MSGLTAPALGAILLAGGRGSRMGGTPKPQLEIDGRSLLARAADAVTDAGAAGPIVVGPRDESVAAAHPRIEWMREDPPFGGPAAALSAALYSASTGTEPEWIFVLACDLARPDLAVQHLVAALPLLPRDADGVCLADTSGRPQWLTGLYRSAPLTAAARMLPDGGHDAPVRVLLDDLAITVISVADDSTLDVDTWEDLERARSVAAAASAASPTDTVPAEEEST